MVLRVWAKAVVLASVVAHAIFSCVVATVVDAAPAGHVRHTANPRETLPVAGPPPESSMAYISKSRALLAPPYPVMRGGGYVGLCWHDPASSGR